MNDKDDDDDNSTTEIMSQKDKYETQKVSIKKHTITANRQLCITYIMKMVKSILFISLNDMRNQIQ